MTLGNIYWRSMSLFKRRLQIYINKPFTHTRVTTSRELTLDIIILFLEEDWD